MPQRMTMTAENARHYESAVKAMSQAAAVVEATRAPVRLAYSRITALDGLLSRLEELRLAGERLLPDDIREVVVAYAERNDAELAARVDALPMEDLSGVHDALFEAQGRVMLQLAELRRVPNWQDLDLTLEPGDDEAA